MVAEQGVTHVRVWSHSAWWPGVCEDGRFTDCTSSIRMRALDQRGFRSEGFFKKQKKTKKNRKKQKKTKKNRKKQKKQKNAKKREKEQK